MIMQMPETQEISGIIAKYHKPEDILDIPEYILYLSENCRLYIRHYRLAPNETVLYAV